MKTQGILKNVRDSIIASKQVKEMIAEGSAAKIAAVKVIPVLKTGYWGWTMESSVLGNVSAELNRSVRAVFCTFDEEVQKALTFTPCAGGWVNRAKLWKSALKPVLSPAQYRTVMSLFLRWYIHCVGKRSVQV